MYIITVLPYFDSCMYWCLAYIREDIFDLRICHSNVSVPVGSGRYINDREEMKFSGFIGNLKTHEIKMKVRKERETPKKKVIAFKATPSTINEEDSFEDSDAGRMGYTGGFQNIAGYGATCVVSNGKCHFWRSVRGDLRAGPGRDSVVLPRCFWAIRARRKKLFKFFLVEFNDERLNHWSNDLMLVCAMALSLVDKIVPKGVYVFYLVKKMWSKIIINFKENYNEYDLITKEGRILNLPFV